MPWMLLSEPPRAEAEPPSELGDVAWVMVGDLAGALQQAGVTAVLLEALPRPRCIFASGVAVVNALLAAHGDVTRFERDWETLRARRFIPSSALGGYRLLVAADGLLDDVAGKLADLGLASTNGQHGVETEIRVPSEAGFETLPADPSTAGWRVTVKAALRRSRASAPLLAEAIREAAAEAHEVVVLGADRPLETHPDVDAAKRLAAASGVSVDFVTTSPEESPGLLEFLLPGSGAPERLVAGGRAAAESWLRATAQRRQGRSGSQSAASDAGSPGTAADGGGPGGDVGARGAWRSEASDASSWEK